MYNYLPVTQTCIYNPHVTNVYFYFQYYRMGNTSYTGGSRVLNCHRTVVILQVSLLQQDEFSTSSDMSTCSNRFLLQNKRNCELFLRCRPVITKRANLIGQLNKHVFTAHAVPAPAGYRHNFWAFDFKICNNFWKKTVGHENSLATQLEQFFYATVFQSAFGEETPLCGWREHLYSIHVSRVCGRKRWQNNPIQW